MKSSEKEYTVDEFKETKISVKDMGLPLEELKKKIMILQHNCWVKEHEKREKIMVVQHGCWVKEHKKRIEDLAISHEHKEAQMRFFVQVIALLKEMKPV